MAPNLSHPSSSHEVLTFSHTVGGYDEGLAVLCCEYVLSISANLMSRELFHWGPGLRLDSQSLELSASLASTSQAMNLMVNQGQM